MQNLRYQKTLAGKPLYFLIFIFLLLAGQHSEGQSNDSSRIDPVPLASIASETVNDIRNTRDLLNNEVQVPIRFEFIREIDSLEVHVAGLQDLSDQIMESSLNFAIYESLILRWEGMISAIEPVRTDLNDYAGKLDEVSNTLNNLQRKWNLTGKFFEPGNLTPETEERINQTISYIDSVRAVVKDSLSATLTLQNRITDLDFTAESYRKALEEAQKTELGKLIFSRNQPIWNLKEDTTSYMEDKAILLKMGIQDTSTYFSSKWPRIVVLAIIFLLSVFAFSSLRNNFRESSGEESIEEKLRYIVLNIPIANAFVFMMLMGIWLLPQKPVLLRDIFAVLFVIPFIPIFRTIVFPSIRFSLIYLFGILLFNIMNDYAQLGVAYSRISNLLESLALFSFHIYYFIVRKKISRASIKGNLFYQLLNTVQPIYFFITLSAVVANLLGYRNYTEVVNEAALFSLLILMLFATGLFSLTSMIYFFFRTDSADKSLILKEYKQEIYRWLVRNLRLATILLWIYYTLRYFRLWVPIYDTITGILQTEFEFGALEFTIGDIFNFVLIIYFSWLISVIIKNLLHIEIFGRMKMPRGVPMAVSSLTQYFLIFLGALLAFSAAGFNMRNLSLLAGALGVGIGFGLQNIVNNFISGLILAFERPVTVGDIVSLEGHEGEVQRIGIRASVIRQWDGSEVIVPNAELISAKVINWTLARYTRRSSLIIQTHLDTDPELVLRLMREAANRVEFVLDNPEAKSYFQGIKDQKLEFNLLYWASGNILDCRSMVNLEVRKTLKAEGIEFIMPVHVMMQDTASRQVENGYPSDPKPGGDHKNP